MRILLFFVNCLVVLVVSLWSGRIAEAIEPEYAIGIAVHNDTIYVADRKLPGVLTLKDGKFSKFFAASKKFGTPLNAVRCLAIDKEGKLLAGDSATRDIYCF